MAIKMGHHHSLGHAGGPTGKAQLAQVLFGIDCNRRHQWIIFFKQFAKFVNTLRQTGGNLLCVLSGSRCHNNMLEATFSFQAQDSFELFFPTDDYPAAGAASLMNQSVMSA